MFEDGEKRCIILFGAPGSGKGTQAEKLLNRVHISTGWLLRRRGYDLSTAKLIPDEVVNKLVVEAIEGVTYDVVLDGYPRTVPQAEFLRDYLVSHDIKTVVIHLAVRDEKILVDRILRRNQGRPDDVEDVVVERMRVYERETLPVLNVLWPSCELWVVDASLHEEYVYRQIKQCLAGEPNLDFCYGCHGDEWQKQNCSHTCGHHRVELY